MTTHCNAALKFKQSLLLLGLDIINAIDECNSKFYWQFIVRLKALYIFKPNAPGTCRGFVLTVTYSNGSNNSPHRVRFKHSNLIKSQKTMEAKVETGQWDSECSVLCFIVGTRSPDKTVLKHFRRFQKHQGESGSIIDWKSALNRK